MTSDREMSCQYILHSVSVTDVTLSWIVHKPRPTDSSVGLLGIVTQNMNVEQMYTHMC
jgi:hypothetical protein